MTAVDGADAGVGADTAIGADLVADVGVAGWYQEMFRASPVAIALADADGLLVLANPAYCALVGRPLAELVGRSSRGWTHPEDLAQHHDMARLMADAEARGEQLRVEKRYLRPDGSVRWGWVSAARATGPGGACWTMAFIQDTTERRVAEDALADAASTDPLTGLLNRRGWQERLDGLAGGAPVSLAVLDLDHFKLFNDARGHAAGDALLVELARRGLAVLPPDALLARWGGEELALALRGDAAAVVRALARRVPEGQTLSAGVAVQRPGEPLEQCWDRADALLYRAKRAGRDRVVTDED